MAEKRLNRSRISRLKEGQRWILTITIMSTIFAHELKKYPRYSCFFLQFFFPLEQITPNIYETFIHLESIKLIQFYKITYKNRAVVGKYQERSGRFSKKNRNQRGMEDTKDTIYLNFTNGAYKLRICILFSEIRRKYLSYFTWRF